ncbi:hypothetical protein BV25DRAFT_1843268 [Artomyces pyxidatus]|uniref:Uncharacterized protein n=1 Tax=Artomyces pyxidatus TaxID=48021 RepID=A0ACB8SEM5_9AGAM|nr:hypothetical protein BV25DRAFT_1843268 [Artomyces pyxidatus]
MTDSVSFDESRSAAQQANPVSWFATQSRHLPPTSFSSNAQKSERGGDEVGACCEGDRRLGSRVIREEEDGLTAGSEGNRKLLPLDAFPERPAPLKEVFGSREWFFYIRRHSKSSPKLASFKTSDKMIQSNVSFVEPFSLLLDRSRLLWKLEFTKRSAILSDDFANAMFRSNATFLVILRGKKKREAGYSQRPSPCPPSLPLDMLGHESCVLTLRRVGRNSHDRRAAHEIARRQHQERKGERTERCTALHDLLQSLATVKGVLTAVVEGGENVGRSVNVGFLVQGIEVGGTAKMVPDRR